MLLLRAILVVALCCAGLGRAAAETGKLALLPLDAPGKLALYGQPVAAEIARVLTAAGLDVVVVGAQMAVPREAVLLVEGSLTSARKKKIKIELRLRTLDSRTPLVTEKGESTLEKLDLVAGEIAESLLPEVRAELDKRRHGAPGPINAGREETPPLIEPPPPPKVLVPLPTALVLVSAAGVAEELRGVMIERMMAAGTKGLSPEQWQVKRVTMPQISDASLMGVAATMPSELSVAFDVREVKVAQKAVFAGSVRARVVVSRQNQVVFDRTVTSDTVVGARKGTLEALLDQLAREVVVILRPRYASFLAAPPAPGPASASVEAAHASR